MVWLSVDAPGVSDVDHEAILDVVASIIADQVPGVEDPLVRPREVLSLAAVAFTRAGLRSLVSESASIRNGNFGRNQGDEFPQASMALRRESRGCVVMEMRASDSAVAVLIRRCRAGALARAAADAERSRGIYVNEMHRSGFDGIYDRDRDH